MAEYRRFIAYFYEYINGKKEKNVGFAKVELRNGVWRILFHLTPSVCPQPPVQVYGFVRREDSYLLGIPMGTIHLDRAVPEEWAYQADVPLNYGVRLEDLSGIWIQSGDERIFITVWDEEEVNTDRFVLELSEESDQIDEQEIVEKQQQVEQPEITEQLRQTDQDETDELRAFLNRDTADRVQNSNEGEKQEFAEEFGIPEELGMSEAENSEEEKCRIIDDEMLERWRCSHPTCHPFADEKIRDCVMLRPCDIVWLQQQGWQVGRSSFLQHGFHMYRHLLFGQLENGQYILGVPGVMTSQEKYMAGLFGFEDFKASRICDNHQTFGYWYRTLES